jgi:hypothetical protein
MKHLVILGATLLGLVSCETSSPTSPVSPRDGRDLATVSQWMPLNTIFFNECPPVEDVAFSGRVHLLSRETAGQSRLFVNWADMKGVGLVTGNAYVLQDNFQDEIISSSTNDTEEVIEHFRMVRQGSLDNLQAFVHLIFDLTAGTVNVLEFRVECRG